MKLPTSETGISILSPARNARGCDRPRAGRQPGFTLWELLIVVAIVGITVSMMRFSVGISDETRELKRVGKDLGKLFHLLNQEAVFESRNYAVSVLEHGFIVLEFNEGQWLPAGESFFTRFKMPESQSSELIIEDKSIDLSPKTSPQPHILILSSGEMTPFEWRIQDRASQSGILLQGNVLGGVLMTGPEPLG